MDPSIFSQLPDLPAAVAEVSNHILGAAGDQIGRRGADALSRLVCRAYSRLHGAGLSEELEERADRLETMLMAVVSELDLQGLTPEFETQFAEPSAARFTADAIEDTISSPSEGKRALFGRMIARRLAVSTETTYELFLRDARQVAARLNEPQLALLGVLITLTATPLPTRSFQSADAAARFFNDSFSGALAAFGATSWNRSDVEKLIADRAIVEVGTRDIGSVGGFSSGLLPRLSFVQSAWLTFDNFSEPLRAVLRTVEEDFGDQRSGDRVARDSIKELWLLPVGAIVGAMVLEAHTHRRILFPEWEGLSHDRIGDESLIAPFSSYDLSTYANDQEAVRSKALSERLKREVPEMLSEEARNRKVTRYIGP